MVGDLASAAIDWKSARRIIRSVYPPVDLFEDIADPEDWPLIISMEQKTNPRLVESIGNLDLVPPDRRVSGPGASYLMAPFTHASPEKPGRFHTGAFGAFYAGNLFEVALMETVHHHELRMASTNEEPGWTSQFRELVMDVNADLVDLRVDHPHTHACLTPNDYSASQALAASKRADGVGGVVYPSVRYPAGECCALFYPDLASLPVQARHLEYHWNGESVDYFRVCKSDLDAGEVFAIKR